MIFGWKEKQSTNFITTSSDPTDGIMNHFTLELIKTINKIIINKISILIIKKDKKEQKVTLRKHRMFHT